MLSLLRRASRNGATTSGEFQAFRSFVITQSSRNVGNACIFTALSMFFAFFKTVSSASATPMLVFVAALPVCAYLAASIAMKCRPAGQEIYMMSILCFRAAYGLSTSTGILPITPWVTYCIHLHMDKLNEILTSGLLEPAPLRFLIPVRILLGVASGGMYEQVGMTLPRLQGALVHAAGLLVAVLVDWRYRLLYQAYEARHQSKSEAALDLEPRLSASTSTAAQPEVPPPYAKTSKAAAAGYAGEATCTQASIGQSHTPCALTAMLGESLLPGDSLFAQLESLEPGSLIIALRQRRYRYKSKSVQIERVAIQLTGDITPHNLPLDATKRLAHIIEERLEGGCVAGMAIRAGCVVICFDVFNVASEGQQPRRDDQELRMLMLKAAEEWRQGLDLGTLGGEGGEAPIAALACLSTRTGQQNLDMESVCSIEALCPVLVMPPKTTIHAIQDKNSSLDEEQHMPHEQGDPARKPPASMVVCLPLLVDITAPAHLGLVRGWHGPSDSPEELEDKESSLCLLAAVQGCFVPLDVLRVESSRVELSINLPAELAATISSCTSVELELWAGGKLACSSTMLLVPASRALVAAELELWTREVSAPEATDFLKDLAHWLHVRQNCCSTMSNSASHVPVVQQLVAVGKDLLLHSLCCGMVGIAGMLLESLVQPPLGLTFAALASEACTYQLESPGDSLQEPGQADSGVDGSLITAQDMIAAAKHSGNAAVLAQCQAWEAQQAGVVPVTIGPAPPTCQAAAIRHAAMALWQWFVMVLPLRPLACRACTKIAAAFSAIAAVNRNSGSRGAAACAEHAARTREYRAWVTNHTATLAKAEFAFAFVHMSILLLKSARENQLDTDAPALAFLAATYLTVTLGSHQYPKWTEVFAVAAFLGRLITCLLLGSGLWPIPSSFRAVFKFRTEAIAEVFVVSCLAPVRIPWLIPLRILLAGGYTTLYAKSGFTHPLLEALAVNGASLLVSILTDRRHRYIYAWHRANTDRGRAGAGVHSSATTSAARCSNEMQDEEHVKQKQI